MNLDQLHFICKKSVKLAYIKFKHNVNNSIFEIDDNIENIYIKELEKDAGTKINKWYVSSNNYSEPQFKVVKEVEKQYLSIALEYAYRYSKRHKKNVKK